MLRVSSVAPKLSPFVSTELARSAKFRAKAAADRIFSVRF
jgi:hypothetical protein